MLQISINAGIATIFLILALLPIPLPTATTAATNVFFNLTIGGKPMQENLSHYLWKGLDFERYAVAKIIPQNSKNAVIIMYGKDVNDPHWCLEYMGGGHYFDTIDQLIDYYNSRFQKPFGAVPYPCDSEA